MNKEGDREITKLLFPLIFRGLDVSPPSNEIKRKISIEKNTGRTQNLKK
jgi:hypothetical protein